ncbi:F-box protein SKIP23-like [Fagus crenata]
MASAAAEAENTAPWSELRRDVLEEIVNRLNTSTDVLHFRAVCSSWRSSIPLPSQNSFTLIKFPFPIGPNPSLNPNRRGHFTLNESIIYSLEPINKISNAWSTTKTWLVKIEHVNTKVLVKEPLSRFPFEKLRQKLPKVLNLLDYRVSEVSKAYELQFVAVGKNPDTAVFNELKSIVIKKVAVSDSKKDKNFTVMAVHTAGKLGVWKMGDKKWTNIDGIDGSERAHYDDIAYYKDKFYAVDIMGLAISVDASTLKIKKVALPMPCSGFHGAQFKYLVKSPKELFMVNKYFGVEMNMFEDEGVGFDSDSDGGDFPFYLKVYKLNEEGCEWVQVESLGDLALFVGDDCCFCVSAKEYVGCKGNCVYFAQDLFSQGGRDDFPGYDTGLFDLEDCTAFPLSTFHGYSKLFWPPPTWLKTKPSSGHEG